MIANARGFRVELLTPHQGTDDRGGELVRLPTTPGLRAQPLRFLDFLIYGEVAAVLLQAAGIPVNVPAPERYAVHKLIVATRRSHAGRAKAPKDIDQASVLIQAFHQVRQSAVLADAWNEAWNRGPGWREALTRGAARLDEDGARRLREIAGEIPTPATATR